MGTTLVNIEEKKKWILEMVNLYWDEENKGINRNELLSYDDNVEKLYIYFQTKEKADRELLLEKYKEEETQEYLLNSEKLHKLVWEAKKMAMNFKEKIYEEENIAEVQNIEKILSNI